MTKWPEDSLISICPTVVPFQASPECLNHREHPIILHYLSKAIWNPEWLSGVFIRHQTPPHTHLSQCGPTGHRIGLSGWDGEQAGSQHAGSPRHSGHCSPRVLSFLWRMWHSPVHTLAFPALHLTVSHSSAAPGEKSTALHTTLTACEKQGLHFSAGGDYPDRCSCR